MNIKDLLQIAGEQGKVVVVDESGEVKGVMVSYSEYQKLTGNTGLKEKPTPEDVTEKINRAILQAQLMEDATVDVAPTPPPAKPAQRLDSLLSKRAEQLFKSMPANRNGNSRPAVDMRSEVVDPNFDYNAPVVTSEDEEIRPNFDDI